MLAASGRGSRRSYDRAVTSSARASARVSARGTRLNRRGLETRQHLLEVAVRVLAEGGRDALSANLVAKEAGATWGVVQHQFGDADGLWAAVLEHLVEQFRPAAPVLPDADVTTRVAGVVDLLWNAVDLPASHAIRNLRLGLPRHTDELGASYPRTAEALARWDRQWRTGCETAFADLPVDPVRLRRVVALLPGAMIGLRDEEHLVTYVDMGEAKEGLAGAITAYLAG